MIEIKIDGNAVLEDLQRRLKVEAARIIQDLFEEELNKIEFPVAKPARTYYVIEGREFLCYQKFDTLKQAGDEIRKNDWTDWAVQKVEVYETTMITSKERIGT